MTAIRTAAALLAATLLNGSVALAVTPGACTAVCGQAIAPVAAMTVAPPARPAHIAARAADAGLIPVSLTLAADETGMEGIAPPRRPADLMTRRAAPAIGVEEVETGREAVAPPRRPANLVLAGTF